MHVLLLAMLLLPSRAFAADPGAFVDQPDMVGRIATVLAASKIDYLTAATYEDGGQKFSYHLKSIDYLGTIERGKEHFILATALFLRSSAAGSDEHPPAKGHGFLICLSPDFRLVCHCRLDILPVELVGTRLRRGDTDLVDFAAHDHATRSYGYLIDGDDALPYPFSDSLPKESAKKP